MPSSSSTAFLDIYAGDKEEHTQLTERYAHTSSLLQKHAAVFDLPSSPELLTSEQQEILIDLNVVLLFSCVLAKDRL